MKRVGVFIFVAIAVVLLMLPTHSETPAAKKGEGTLQDKYHMIQVGDFDIQPGVDFPPNYLASLPQQVIQRLRDSKKFAQVLAAGEKSSLEDAPVMRLRGIVTGYDAGKRGKRYIGFGMGLARLFVTLEYLDKNSGQIIYQDKVIGTLSGGLFGGNENKVVDELARTIEATTKLVLLRRLGDPNNVVEPTTAADSNPADRQTIEMKGDLKLVESRLNELAGQGFRVVDFRVTGNKSADVTMQKTASPPQTHRYLVVHALLTGNVQKNMNQAGAEGYRLVRHTVAMLGGLTLIMEKSPGDAAKYEYHVNSSMRGSSAEKHLIEDQQSGFVMVEAGKLQQINLVLTEKEIHPEEANR